MDSFTKRKTDILLKSDKSTKGSWDKRIVGLCGALNETIDYYTTSSCSGKTILMEEKDVKDGSYYLWVSHELISVEEIKEVFGKLSSKLQSPTSNEANPNSNSVGSSLNSASPVYLKSQKILTHPGSEDHVTVIKGESHLIKFKCEPPILHVACRTLGFAQALVNKAKQVGFKRSGIMTTVDKYVVELCSVEKLECHIFRDGKFLVDDDFLDVLVEQANIRRQRGWKKIEALRQLIL